MKNIYQELKKLINTEKYFLICKKCYFECLENNGLRHDLSSTIENVSVSVILKDFVDYDYYEIETELLIVGPNDTPIGSYRYIEDNNGNPVDDFWEGDFPTK